MNFKDYFLNEDLSDNIASAAKKVAKFDVGKAGLKAIRALDPYYKRGVLGLTAKGLKDAEKYLQAGGDKKEQSSVEKWRIYKIYPQDTNTAFNTEVEGILNLKFPIQPKDQAPHFYEWVVNRNRPIKHAAHIANLVMDQYVKNLQKQIPKDRALQNALDDTIDSGELKRFISRSGMIAAV